MNILESFPQYGPVSADEVEEVIFELRESADELEALVDSPAFEIDDDEEDDE
jgi:hypothetical protein